MSLSKVSFDESLSVVADSDSPEAPPMCGAERLVVDEGLKLTPTPTDDPDDPRNWPLWIKIAILVQTSLLAAIGGLNTASINPALVQLAHEFHISTVRASYQTTVCIALNGIAPWLWIPLAHRYGRRPVWLVTTLLAFVSILGCAYAKTYTQLVVARVFNGFFPVGFALGATTVVDLFFYHQRGRAMGFFTVTVVNGSHLAPILGGLVGQYCGWRWIFKILAIVDAVLFLVAFFCLPETLYTPRHLRRSCLDARRSSQAALVVNDVDAPISSVPPTQPYARGRFEAYVDRMRLVSFNPNSPSNPSGFLIPTLRLFLSPLALFPALYYSSMYGFASILPAVTAAAIFTRFFHWNTLRIGLSYGVALTVGGSAGEAFAGWVCDFIVQRYARRLPDGAKLPPEIRLRPIWPGAILTPTGLLVYGFTLQYRANPALPLFGVGLACFGLQIITTTCYTYAIDCHREQSAEVAQLFNFVRQCFGMTFAFYAVDMGEAIGFQWMYLLFTCCGGVLAFSLIVALMFRGPASRQHADKVFGPGTEVTS